MTGKILKRYKWLLSLIAVPLLILALTLSPAVGADDGGDIKVKVVGDEQLLDDVWDKVESSITDMPEDAVLTAKCVSGPEEGNGWASEIADTHCIYAFSHIVNGKKVPGDRFVVIINADTLERTPVWFYAPLNEVGSIEAVLASKRPMIWDGSRAWEGDINFLPPYEVPAGYSYEAPGYENGDHGEGWEMMRDNAWSWYDEYFPYDGSWHSYRDFNDLSALENHVTAPETSLFYEIGHSCVAGGKKGFIATSNPWHCTVYTTIEDWMGDRHPMELAMLMSCHAMDNPPNDFEGAFRKGEAVNTFSIGLKNGADPPDPDDPAWRYHWQTDFYFRYSQGYTAYQSFIWARNRNLDSNGYVDGYGQSTVTLQDQKDNPFVSCGLADELDHIDMVYLYESGEWYYYDPDWPYSQNTLHQLEMGKAYWINVDGSCTLEYGDNSYNLYTGWNNVGWGGYD